MLGKRIPRKETPLSLRLAFTVIVLDARCMAGSGYYAAGRPGSSAQDRGAVPWGIDADTPLPKLPGYDFKDPRARAQKIAAFAYLSRTSGAPKFKFCHP